MPRAADGERERALASLRHHYLEGRLDADELARRADAAVRARSTADLRAALRDLPRFSETLARARTTAQLAVFLGALTGAWLVVSAFAALALLVAAFAGGGGTAVLVVFTLWLAVSLLLLASGKRRLRTRPR